jgi:hypothetical protein
MSAHCLILDFVALRLKLLTGSLLLLDHSEFNRFSYFHA